MNRDLNPYYSTKFPSEVYRHPSSTFFSLYKDRIEMSQEDWLTTFKERLRDHVFVRKLVSELRYSNSGQSDYYSFSIPESIPYVYYDAYTCNSNFIKHSVKLDQQKAKVVITDNKKSATIRKNHINPATSRNGTDFVDTITQIRKKEDQIRDTYCNKTLIFDDKEAFETIANYYLKEGYCDLKSIKEDQIDELKRINRTLYFDAVESSNIKGEYKFDVLLHLLKWLVGGNFLYRKHFYELDRDIIESLGTDNSFPYEGDITELNRLRLKGARKFLKIKLLDHIVACRKEGESIYWQGILENSKEEFYLTLRTGDERLDNNIINFLLGFDSSHSKDIIKYYLTFYLLNADLNKTEVHEAAKNKDIPFRVRNISYSTFNNWVVNFNKFLNS